METFEAKILVKNLLKRIRKVDNDTYELNSTLTDDEVLALEFALASLDKTISNLSPPTQDFDTTNSIAEEKSKEASSDPPLELEAVHIEINLVTNTLHLPPPPEDRRLCLDFGTAMSKVTLVRDNTKERNYEDIEVLKLGIPGDQEEVSQTMLVSSVFIDSDGILRFGHKAVQYSQLEGQNGDRQRLDNIKRYLSEEGLNSPVSKIFNPTDIEITYGDMVLAYLMFLTWAVNYCLKDINEPRNLNRRYAMPCLDERKARHASHDLSRMLGEAQILADTFFTELQNGISLASFIEAASQLKTQKNKYIFVKENVAEPLGVAGAIISWKQQVNSLIMVVDVGAGTSDFSMYRMSYDTSKDKSMAFEVENSSEGITEAGNYLDKLLKGLILREAGIDSTHSHWINIQGNLELDLRDYKERLFLDSEIVVRLFNEQIISITLDQFLSLDQVVQFGKSLKECRDRILSRVDRSFIHGAPHDAVALALTGGGASLPMVKALAEGTVTVQGKELKLVQATNFPQWLKEEYPELESDYPRISVSLGGARKKLISRGTASVTAGDIKSPPILDGYYSKG
ncbi:hypothetical protein O5O45_11340 [Hahella aquimaris]|uniref:hypothetical protein n=1 Tax=Hahella sp. HNIBRBA332 TaxID=3015983 RepID=UPI00273AF567|nr:hypothetical protein [Hahella sp. HNIBRBA332]WLQ16513.1 hypothetical protein O5O45_11340 [Hahella sp. HNIBRBA332]